MAVAPVAAPSALPVDDRPAASLPAWVRPGAVAAVVAGVAFRLWSPSALWLDEALTVNIAALPLGDIPEALRHDGAPPLYYFLLHFWVELFGTSDAAVRSLSSLFAVANLPLAFLVGKRYGGERVAWLTLVLLAVSPFAVRYSTEARMYSLVVLLALVGMLAVARAVDRPGRLVPLVAVGLVSGLLALSHYWNLFLLAAVFVALVVRRATRVAVAMAVGAALLFGPWLPSFLYQSAHTGTPWGGIPRLRVAVDAVINFAGGHDDPGFYLGLLFLALVALAVWGRPVENHRVELRWPTDRRASRLALVVFGALLTGALVSMVARSAFVPRYASGVLPPFLVVVAIGIAKLPARRAQPLVASACVLLSVLGAVPAVTQQRTQAHLVARAVERYGQPGDLVVYCPDQLGPATYRILGDRHHQLVYPTGGAPAFVDWVDYEERNKAADPAAFARMVLDRVGANRVFYVWAPGYRTFGQDCYTILESLRDERGSYRYLVRRRPGYYEPMNVVAVPAP